MRNFIKIPSRQLAHPGMPEKEKAWGGGGGSRHREMLSDRATCLMGAGGREQQGERKGKSKHDLSEQGGKWGCERRHELNANNLNAWLRSSPCHLLWPQILSSFHLRLSLGNFTQAQRSNYRHNLWLVGAEPVAKAWWVTLSLHSVSLRSQDGRMKIPFLAVWIGLHFWNTTLTFLEVLQYSLCFFMTARALPCPFPKRCSSSHFTKQVSETWRPQTGHVQGVWGRTDNQNQVPEHTNHKVSFLFCSGLGKFPSTASKPEV